MYVVVDTNIIISALGFGGKPLFVLYLCISSPNVHLVISPQILEEVSRVATKKLDYDSNDLVVLREMLTSESRVVNPGVSVKIVRDPDDNKFIETAIEGKADFIVSSDKDLLAPGSYKNIKILATEAFLKLIQAG